MQHTAIDRRFTATMTHMSSSGFRGRMKISDMSAGSSFGRPFSKRVERPNRNATM